MTKSVINPFDEMIVKEPRRREPAVRGLNEKPLEVLSEKFEQLAAGAAPREIRRIGEAVLVTSSQPGYGKSHLIGRVFRELHGRATFVYVLPFQNSATVFQSLMLAIVREMHFPDRADAGAWDREEATQLDHLAHCVLAHIVADLVEGGRDVKTEEEDRAAVIERLRRDPMGSFNRGVSGTNWADWMRTHFARLLPLFEERLAERGLAISAPGAWLRVLFAYAFAPFDSAIRRICLDWLTAQPLENDDLGAINLRPADSVSAEVDSAESNHVCRSRLADICQLAVFFRPFVFCFDQTEVYGHHPALARSFGMVVARLVDEAPNHLTLVTSNQEPWTERIAIHVEKADLDRIAKPPLPLEGLNRAQAEELARLRLVEAAVEPARAEAFLGTEWFGQLFSTAENRMGARQFLQRCKERWDKAPARTVPLSELYHRHREKLLASPKRHLFEPDTLQWLVEDAAGYVDGIEVERLEEKYFTVSWQTPQRMCFFGFVSGAHWRQWRAIAQAAVVKCRGNTRPGKTVFFRTPEQRPIPGPKWSSAVEIEAAKAKYLQLLQLNVEEMAELYAAKELFADAAQGDIAYSTDETLKFLAGQLAPWWERLRAPINGADAGNGTGENSGHVSPEDLAQKVREVVHGERLVSVEEVISKLGGGATAQEVLEACGFSAEIRVQTHPDGTVLQWQDA